MLLDEPTVGLDPIEAERIRSTIVRLRERGSTVLLTSHYLLDVEKLADRVLVLSEGTIASDMSLGAFLRRAGFAAAVVVRGRGPMTGFGPPLPYGIEVGEICGGYDWQVTLRVRTWSPSVFMQIGQIFAACTVVDVNVRDIRLEEAYARLVGLLP
jgi:ABC-2 type transport system ATP-binding protein